MVCCPQASRPQTSWNLKVDDADSYLPHHQPIRRMSMSGSHPLWTITIKLLTILSKWGHIVFWGRRSLCHPLPGKVIKLSFSTSPQTLFPRFDSALVYREAELSASIFQIVAAPAARVPKCGHHGAQPLASTKWLWSVSKNKLLLF